MAIQKRAETFPSAIKALKSWALCSIVPEVQGFMLAFLCLEIFSAREKQKSRLSENQGICWGGKKKERAWEMKRRSRNESNNKTPERSRESNNS